jgi:hypothetical protein
MGPVPVQTPATERPQLERIVLEELPRARGPRNSTYALLCSLSPTAARSSEIRTGPFTAI